MAYKDPRGNYRLKRSFGFVGNVEVGALNVTLGTDDPALASRYEDAVNALGEPDVNRGDLLLDVKEGRRSPREIYEMTRRQQVSHVHNISNARMPLGDALRDWLPKALKKNHTPIAERTRKSYAGTMQLLLKPKFTAKPGKVATVAELPDVYRRFHKDYHAREKYRTINKVSALLLAFARSTQQGGVNSDLYRALQALPKAPTRAKRQRKGQTVWQVRTILENIPAEQFRNIAKFMAFTGCHGAEYREGFVIKPDRIIIHGTKNENRNRVVPRVDDFKVAYLSNNYNDLNQALKDASGDPDFTHYDLRASYQQWLKEAGVPDVRVKRYMGHITRTVSDGYDAEDRVKFEQNFERDTAAFIRYVEDNWNPPKVTKKKAAPKRLKVKLNV